MTEPSVRPPLTSVQARIHDRLRLMGPGPAAFFQDACQIYNDPHHYHLETATHLIGHCLREVESAVSALLLPQTFVPVKNDGNAHAKKVMAILSEYEIGVDTAVGRAWLDMTDRLKDRALHKLAHRINLEHPRALDEDYQLQYEQALVFLEGVTSSFEERFVPLIKAVEAQFQEPEPTADHLKLLRERVPNNPATLTHLFSKITSGKWLKALWDGKFFQRPPEARPNNAAGRRQYVSWPQADLLLRFAKDDPTLTVEIICRTPTSNPAIAVTFLQCLLALPAEEAAKASEPVLDWASTLPELRANMLLPEFIPVLARGGDVNAAVTLARLLLMPMQDGPSDASVSGGRYDRGRAAYILEHHLHALQEVSPEAHYEVLSGLFRTLEGSAPVSASSWYRPRIAPHIDALSSDLRDVILDAIRDSAQHLIVKHPERAPGVINDLWNQDWKMARRVALYLASCVVDGCSEAAEVLLLNTETMTSPEFEDEYLDLLSAAFPRLSVILQETLLERIEHGPNWRREAGLSEDDLRYWQHRSLSVIKPVLTGERLAWADQLEAEFRPYDRNASHMTAMFVGPTSPFTADTLAALDPEEVLDLLVSWQDEATDGDWHRRPTVDGLARVAQQRFEADPASFAALAERFLNLQPAYTDALLLALRTAVDSAHSFEWRPVLELCVAGHQLANETRPPAGRKAVRRSLAMLLEAGFKTREHPLPWSLRSMAWDAVKPITDDPNPEPADEAKLTDEWNQLVGLSINSARSLGMMAVLRYAGWVRIHQDELQATSGFDRMPEVRRVLEIHLDPKREPSLAVRAVYGSNLPLLFWLDPDWTRQHLSLIFPAGHPKLQQAAWNGYLRQQRVLPELFSVVSPYRQAIESLQPGDAFRRDSAQDQLARHLMVITLRGELSTEPPDRWLNLFFEQASPALRQSAIRWVAQTLEFSEESEDVLQRARALFDWRLLLARSASEAERDAFRAELAGIGAWVTVKDLGGRWFMNSVQAVLALGGRIEHFDEVARALPALSGVHPGQALNLLEHLLPQLTPYRLEKFSRQVVAAALKDEHAREAAEAYIHRRTLNGDYSLMSLQDDALA